MKKYLSIMLVLSMLLSIFAIPTGVWAADYENHWSKDAVKALIDAGYITADSNGDVNPDAPMPRYEFVTLMNKLSQNLGVSPTGFNDIAEGSPYYTEFAKAKAAGMIQGDENGNANPEGTITRAEVAAIISRAMRLDSSKTDTSALIETDVPVWAMPYIALMRDNGVMIGNGDGTYSAYDTMTKAQGYQMAARLVGNKQILSDESCITVQDSGKWHEDWERPTETAGKLKGFEKKHIEVQPAIRSFSVKVSYVEEGVTFKLFYKKMTEEETQWKRAYDFTYVPSENAYYASATMTGNGNGYDGMVYPYVDGVAYDPIKFTWTAQNRNMYDKQYEPYFYSPEELLIKATYENASYYVTYDDPDYATRPTPTPTPVPEKWEPTPTEIPFDTKAVCTAYYREKGESEFKEAVLNQYDVDNKQFRGSITGLKEGTEYDFKAVITKDGKEEKTVESTFTTNNSNVPIAKIVQLKDVVKNQNGTLVLEHLNGTEDGYIKIVDDGTTVINGGERKGVTYDKSSNEAVVISNCHYVVLEGFSVTGGGTHGMYVGNHSTHVQIINFDISGWGRQTVLTANVGGYEAGPASETGGRVNNDSGIVLMDVNDILVDRCYIHDPRGKSNAWYGPKGGEENGVAWNNAHPAGPEGMFVRGRGNIVVRYCDIIGSDDHRWNDCLEGVDNGYKYGSFGRDADFYGNMLSCAQDDAVEFDGGGMNIRVYQNRMEQTYTNISTAPTMAGPIYIFRNLVFNGGDEYFAYAGHMKQGGGNTYSMGRNFVINNTFEANGTGIRDAGFGSDSNRKHHLVTAYNNIVVVGKGSTAISAGHNERESDNVYDYNVVAQRASDGSYTPAKTGKGGVEFTMPHGSFGLPSYVNLIGADFRLNSDDVIAKNKGMVIPNMTDGYKDNAPDIGALEYGKDDYFLPFRPIDMSADAYMIDGSGKITVKTGDIESIGYKVEIVDAIKWLTVTPSEGTFSANSSYTFDIKVDINKMTRAEEQTVMLIRLKNGYSIPITVKAQNPSFEKIVSGH